MSITRKLFASLTALALLFVATVNVALAGTFFNDVNEGDWFAPYVDQLTEEGVFDDSKEDFRPNDSINRAEAIKTVVEAFLGGVDEDVIPETPTFADVPADAWFFPYVETAVAYDIVNSANENFRPTDPATRAELLKMDLEAGQVETLLTPAQNFSDVAAADWFVDYVTTGANHCIIDGTKAQFYPNNNMTRAEFAKVTFGAMKVANGESLCTDEPTETDPTEEPTEEPTEPVDPNAVSDASVEITTSPDQRGKESVPNGGNLIEYMKLNISASGDEAVELRGLTTSIGGLGDEEAFDEIFVYTTERKGSGASVSSQDRTARVSLRTDPVVIEPGTTATIRVLANLVGDDENTQFVGDEHVLSIDTVDDFEFFGAETGAKVTAVTADAPLMGAEKRIASVSVGSLEVQGRSLPNQVAELGTQGVTISRFRLAAGSEEDMVINSIEFEQQGTADSQKDAQNYTLYQGSDVVAGPVNAVGDIINFHFDEPFLLNDGDSREFKVTADLFDGIKSTLQLGFEDDADVAIEAIGLQYGFMVSIEEGTGGDLFPNADVVTINGGDFNVSANSVARDVARGGEDVELATFTFVNAGEDVIVRNMDVIVMPANGASASDFTDIKFVAVDGADAGSVKSGPKDGTTTGLNANQEINFPNDFEIGSGETMVLSLQADIADNMGDGETVRFEFQMDTLEIKGITSGDTTIGTGAGKNHELKPTSNITTKTLTIAEPGVDFVASSLASDFVVTAAKDVVLWTGTAAVREAEGVTIERLDFTQTVGGLSDPQNIENCALWVVEGAVETKYEGGESVDSNKVVFSELNLTSTEGIELGAGEEVVLELRCDVASDLSESDGTPATGDETAKFALTDATVTDEERESADDNIPGAPGIESGATFTLLENGNLEVTLEANKSPDSKLVMESVKGVALAAFRFDANYEDARVKKLTVKIDGDAEAIDKVALFYDDGTPVLKEGQTGGPAVTSSIDSDGRATINALDLVIDKTTDTLIHVRVDTRAIETTGAKATGESGMTFSASLLLREIADSPDFEINGADSGDAYTVVGADGSGADIETDVATAGLEQTDEGDTMYLMNNQVIATKSANQATSLATGSARELLKFTLTPSGGNTTYLKQVVAEISLTDANDDNSLTVDTVDLYSGATKIGEGADDGNIWTITIDPDYASKVVIDAANYDEIKSGGETYTIKANVEGVGVDDVITTTVNINALEPGDDDITWRDYGKDGTDGVDMSWIDLGSDESTSRIENQVDNK